MLRRAGWAGAHPARWIDGLRAVIESGRDAPSKAVADHALGMGRSGLRVGESVGWGGRALTPLIDDRLYLLYGLTSTSSRRYAAASAGCGASSCSDEATGGRYGSVAERRLELDPAATAESDSPQRWRPGACRGSDGGAGVASADDQPPREGPSRGWRLVAHSRRPGGLVRHRAEPTERDRRPLALALGPS